MKKSHWVTKGMGRLLAGLLTVSLILGSYSFPAFAAEVVDADGSSEFGGASGSFGDELLGDEEEWVEEYDIEYNYLDITKRLSWGETQLGSVVPYQQAVITNHGVQDHDFTVSITSSDLWDVILPPNTTIAAGKSVSIQVRPKLTSNKWTAGVYTDVLTISGFDADHCDITDVVSVNLYVTVVQKVSPWVGSVSVSPSSVSLSKGQSYTFQADVVSGDGADSSVNWSISGQTSGNTSINQSGTLTIGGDENASGITVTATSRQDGSVRGTATVTLNKNRFNINTQSQPYDGGSTTGGGSFNDGVQVTVIANPANGYRFDGWYENNVKISSDARCSFAASGNRTLVAVFTQNCVRINTKKNIDNAGSITGSQTVQIGSDYTVTAKANSGYKFVGWYEGNNLITNAESYTMKKITQNRELNAVFQQSQFKVQVNATPAEGGTVSGGGTYNMGQQVNLVAKPAKGYTFMAWVNNNQVISSEANCSISGLDRDYSVAAVFKKDGSENKNYTIVATGSNGGTISPAGNIPALSGKTVVFTISANKDYRIADVKVDGKSQGALSGYSFYNVACDHTISVTFEKVSGTATNTVKPQTTTAQVASTGNGTVVTDQKPTTDEATAVEDAGTITDMRGTLQDLNITPDEAKLMIQSKSDRVLMENALARGDLKITVVNRFSDVSNETTSTSYYDLVSVPNMESVIDSLLTPDQKLELFEGGSVKANLNISAMNESEVREGERAIFQNQAATSGLTIGTYFDVCMISDIIGDAELVTNLDQPLRIVMNVPVSMQGMNADALCVMRLHEGQMDILMDQDTDPNTVTFETDKMSTFAIACYGGETVTSDNGSAFSSSDQSLSAKQKDNKNVVVFVLLGIILVGTILLVVTVVASSSHKHHKKRRR